MALSLLNKRNEFKFLLAHHYEFDAKLGTLTDIRDDQSFAAAHVEGAFHLTNFTMAQFSQEVEFETPVLVFCYHGHSSQGAAQYLVNQGYEEVYSVDGGFEMWKVNFPFVSGSED